MEQWNDGILGPSVFHLVEKIITVHCNILKLQALKFYFCAFCGYINLDPNTEVMRF
jgi:hypothetical protein